jgi:glycosyltransferase involved in cell wall biosynthesis
MPAVSVILPTHDRPELLTRAARSVLEQSFEDLELIVVDDASREPAERALRCQEDRRTRVLRTDVPLGPARARNLGLEVAVGDWIAFQDDDDEWLPAKLERQMESALRADPRLGVVYCPFWRVGRDGSRIPSRHPEVSSGQALREELLRGNFIGLPTAVVRRGCFEEVGRFDPELRCFEDWELFIRIAARFDFERVDEPLVQTHDSPASVNKADSAIQAEAFRRILDNHREAIEANPSVHADFMFHIAHHLCMSGDLRRGREFAGRALRTRPSLRGAVTLATSLFGGGAYRTLARLYEGLRRAG